MTYITSKQKMTSRRAVAPIIATLLLVAIAVVGGSIVFVFSQGFFSSAQVSGAPNIESLKFTGYDATDGAVLKLHDGVITTGIATGVAGDGLVTGERIAVYVQNQGVNKVTLGEIRFAGSVYTFTSSPGVVTLAPWVAPGVPATYSILTKSPGTIIDTTSPEIQPGQQATIILELAENVKTGRDAQFKLSTSNGAVFVGTVIAGQQSG
ncbi:archaellin/type IV pilin N-terminal domain-containing protein [Candidatus Nitrosarchaeum limnium]|jgi:flagellin-like protein|uniref:Archaeal flagellin N-terminal-like domain protein n=1 Tax=Candidatus Nitrosarchaeum limnium BG20 TaxID=859192 RepID=S2E729_9ARCH|nr:archaellin/type IV pilin N-terminal domain-containing protein [Candidatus Nitrosarchaeum limnium]EPA05276.1 archaeal flagellin N-terminal-like domain protein [Candidatus Nitrosarchaeum limnium BG20]